jgi:hypothetical protein
MTEHNGSFRYPIAVEAYRVKSKIDDISNPAV